MTTAVDEALTLVAPVAKPKHPPHEFSRRWVAALLVGDIAMFLLSALLANVIVFHHMESGEHFNQRAFAGTVISVVLWLGAFRWLGLYTRSFALSIRDEFYYTITALCLGTLPVLAVFTLWPQLSTSRADMLCALGLSIVLVSSLRATGHAVRNVQALYRPKRIAIVGDAGRIAAAAESLNITEGTHVLRIPVENVEETVTHINLTHDKYLDSIHWFKQAKEWGCDTLILTEILPPHALPHILQEAMRESIEFAFAPPRLRAHAYALSLRRNGQQALIVPQQLRACRPAARILKRVFDIAVATLILIPALPVMALAAIAIMIESGRPIFFQQDRVGIGGRIFPVLKFRSMRVNAEAQTGPVWVRKDDNRVTRVGAFMRRTSIDELPQLFNVLRGEMSIVGPRPERPVFVEAFRAVLPRYDERHLVRPGITGWSQVQMKRLLDTSEVGEKLSYDLFYVENWSLFMDFSVVSKTAFEFLFHKVG